MSVLQATLDSAQLERTPQRLLLVGAEGVGRSRLLAHRAQLRVDVGRGPLLRQTLVAFLGDAVREGEAAVLAALAAAPALLHVDPERAAVAVELLASLLGIRRPDFRTARLDDDARREGAALELGRWLVERAARGVFVAAFDDAHLADAEGVAFLDALSQREERAPLVLVVAADADGQRHTPSFRARFTAWSQDKRWRRVELKPPARAELEAELERLGASTAVASALVAHAGGNPGLCFGLYPHVRDGAALPSLPVTLDGLRLLRVRALGPEALEAMATLAALGGRAPVAALSAVHATMPLALSTAQQLGLVESTREGPFELLQLTDPRLRSALEGAVAQTALLGARLSAGAWAVQALDEVSPRDFGAVASFLVPLATPVLDGQTASWWDEAWACAAGGRAEALEHLEAAMRGAVGVRRLVLARRLAELKLFLGQPDEAIAVVATALRANAAPVQPLPVAAVGRVLDALAAHVLDRWDRLTWDEAQAALEVVRAECLSHLVKKDETQRAFSELERRLLKLRGIAVAHLWIRWARGWSWFLCEIMGRAPDALRACQVVRKQVSAEVLAADEDAIAFVRAEEVVASSLGHFTHARQLSEEHIALAERAGRLRDACLGWNARAIVYYGQGELLPARKAFEHALELARSTGWLRREAITLHNLTLVLAEQGEFDLAYQFESTYSRLSVLMGNHAGKAEAPLVLASIELARGRLREADALVQSARKVAETNGWDMLSAWGRALTGRLRLVRYRSSGDVLEVTKAKNDLMAAIEVFEEHNLAWTEEIDPGEVFAQYAIALKWSGQAAQAQHVLADALRRFPAENALSRQELATAQAFVSNQPMDACLAWFEQRGFIRRRTQWGQW